MDVISVILLVFVVAAVLSIERQLAGIGATLRATHGLLNDRLVYSNKLLAEAVDKLDAMSPRSPFPEPPPVDPEVAEILRDKPIPPPVTT